MTTIPIPGAAVDTLMWANYDHRGKSTKRGTVLKAIESSISRVHGRGYIYDVPLTDARVRVLDEMVTDARALVGLGNSERDALKRLANYLETRVLSYA